MKVLQVIGGGEKGGSRKYIIQLCKGLIEEGHSVELVCFLEDVVAASAREQKIPVTVLPMANIFDLRAVSKLRRHIKEERPIWCIPTGLGATLLAGWRQGCRCNCGDYCSQFHLPGLFPPPEKASLSPD